MLYRGNPNVTRYSWKSWFSETSDKVIVRISVITLKLSHIWGTFSFQGVKSVGMSNSPGIQLGCSHIQTSRTVQPHPKVARARTNSRLIAAMGERLKLVMDDDSVGQPDSIRFTTLLSP